MSVLSSLGSLFAAVALGIVVLWLRVLNRCILSLIDSLDLHTKRHDEPTTALVGGTGPSAWPSCPQCRRADAVKHLGGFWYACNRCDVELVSVGDIPARSQVSVNLATSERKVTRLGHEAPEGSN